MDKAIDILKRLVDFHSLRVLDVLIGALPEGMAEEVTDELYSLTDEKLAEYLLEFERKMNKWYNRQQRVRQTNE